MKVIIICIVLFALTYNVNGAPAEVENNINDNYLEELLKQSLSAEKDESETAPAAKLDDNVDDNDNEMMEALFVASLMNEKMNGEDNEEWLKRAVRRVRRVYRKARNFYKKHKVLIHAGIHVAKALLGKKK
jgi:hypothetical protein